MDTNINTAASAVQPASRPQSSDNKVSVHKDGRGAASGFAPRTNVNIRNSVNNMAGILSKISSNAAETEAALPKSIQHIIDSVMKGAFSVESSIGDGVGSALSSSRFSIEQLNVLNRLVEQLALMTTKGQTSEMSDELGAFLNNLKTMLDKAGAPNGALLNKLAFQIVSGDGSTKVEIPQELQQLLAQIGGMIQAGSNAQGSEGQNEGMNFLKQLVDAFFPKSMFRGSGGTAENANPQPQGQTAQGQTAQQGQGMPQQAQNGQQGQAMPQQTQNNPQGQVMPQQAQNNPQGQAAPQQAQNSQQGQTTPQQTQNNPQGQATPQQAQNSQQGQATPQQAQNSPQAMPQQAQGGSQQTMAQQPQGNSQGTQQGQANQNMPQGTTSQPTQTSQPGGQPSQAAPGQPNTPNTPNAPTQQNGQMQQSQQNDQLQQGRTNRGGGEDNPLFQNIFRRQGGGNMPGSLKAMLMNAGRAPVRQAVFNQPPMFQNTPQNVGTMREMAQMLLRDNTLSARDSQLLQNFINGNQGNLSQQDAKQLNLLLRMVQNNIPVALQQAGQQQGMEDLPRLWAFMQLCEMASLKDLKAKELRNSSKQLVKFLGNMKGAMQSSGAYQADGQKSISFMIPLYLGENEKSYPTYVNIYDSEPQQQRRGKREKETWLRMCVLTENIGAVEMTCRLYEGNHLNLKVLFSEESIAKDFKEYVPELRASFRESSLSLKELKLGSFANMEIS